MHLIYWGWLVGITDCDRPVTDELLSDGLLSRDLCLRLLKDRNTFDSGVKKGRGLHDLQGATKPFIDPQSKV